MKKYKPILFSTPMVEAILEGRKTQTRRIVKKKYSNTDLEFRTDKYGTSLVEMQNDVPPPTKMPDGRIKQRIKCFVRSKPKYQVRNILWVREAWAKFGQGFIYKADGLAEYEDLKIKWKPSIHMPREAARIFLEVVSVRAERLQDISEKDAFAEGFNPLPIYPARDMFLAQMNGLYGAKTMIKNPFVWVYEFKQVEKTKDFLK